MTLRCPHPHIPPFDAVSLPDPGRPDWDRLVCRQCGTFLGYQAPEEIARSAGSAVDLENSEKKPKTRAQVAPLGAIDYVRGHFGP